MIMRTMRTMPLSEHSERVILQICYLITFMTIENNNHNIHSLTVTGGALPILAMFSLKGDDDIILAEGPNLIQAFAQVYMEDKAEARKVFSKHKLFYSQPM